MKTLKYFLPAASVIFLGWKNISDDWMIEKNKTYILYYTTSDQKNKVEYTELIQNGIETVKTFFDDNYKKEFNIYIHPNRQSLDNQWRKDWQMPQFKSECWMVASGTGYKLDLISPKLWDMQSCEHQYADKIKTQQLITHELVHVYHGQINISHDFNNVENIDWFVEGLATYASGQCDSIRMAEIKKLIRDDKQPNTLDEFWQGKYKYGLSGSMVMYIDKIYGRLKLKETLKYNKKTEILGSLGTVEADLLEGWMKYMEKYKPGNKI